MGMQNTAKHLAYLKAQLKKVRSADEPGVFFLVFSRSSKDAILHIDLKSSASKYKNPRVIRQRLLKAKQLQPEEYEPFFKDPKLVSVAGPVRYDTDGKTVCFGLDVGKATAGDLKAGLRFFRFIKDVRIDAAEDSSEAPESTG